VHGHPHPGGQGHITPVRRAQQDVIARAEPVSLAVFAAIFAFFAVVALVDIMAVARRGAARRTPAEPRSCSTLTAASRLATAAILTEPPSSASSRQTRPSVTFDPFGNPAGSRGWLACASASQRPSLLAGRCHSPLVGRCDGTGVG
jgi:hypothetical protein